MSEHREIRGEVKEVHKLGTDPEGNELLLVLEGDRVARVHRITPDGEDRHTSSPHGGETVTPPSNDELLARIAQLEAKQGDASEEDGEEA